MMGVGAICVLVSHPCRAEEAGSHPLLVAPPEQISEQLEVFSQPRAEISIAAAPDGVGNLPPIGSTPPSPSQGLDRLIDLVSEVFSIDRSLLNALVRCESGGDPLARSRAGAVGLGQIMPGTAAKFGISPTMLTNPAINLSVAASELRRLQVKYHGDLRLALAAYNAGEGAVARHGGGAPPYRETLLYVDRVMAWLSENRLLERRAVLGYQNGY
jgi:soluble lytic murein transglycosylase-like protein